MKKKLDREIREATCLPAGRSCHVFLTGAGLAVIWMDGSGKKYFATKSRFIGDLNFRFVGAQWF